MNYVAEESFCFSGSLELETLQWAHLQHATALKYAFSKEDSVTVVKRTNFSQPSIALSNKLKLWKASSLQNLKLL